MCGKFYNGCMNMVFTLSWRNAILIANTSISTYHIFQENCAHLYNGFFSQSPSSHLVCKVFPCKYQVFRLTHSHWHCYQVHHPFTMHRQSLSWVKFIIVSYIQVYLTTSTCSNKVCHIFVHPLPPILPFYFRECPPNTSMPCQRTFMIFRDPFPLDFFLTNNSKQCVRPLLGVLPKMASLKEVRVRLLPDPLCLFLCS